MINLDFRSFLSVFGDIEWQSKFRATESIGAMLEGLSTEQAQNVLSQEELSIEGILQHLTHWKIYYTRFLLEEPVEDLGPRLPDDGSAPIDMPRWPEIKYAFYEAHQSWQRAVQSISNEKLLETHPGNRSGLNVAHVIGLLAIHDAYHIGQIYMIRAMLDSQKP